MDGIRPLKTDTSSPFTALIFDHPVKGVKWLLLVSIPSASDVAGLSVPKRRVARSVISLKGCWKRRTVSGRLRSLVPPYSKTRQPNNSASVSLFHQWADGHLAPLLILCYHLSPLAKSLVVLSPLKVPNSSILHETSHPK